MKHWQTPGPNEASGLAYSREFAMIAYVHDDENHSLYIMNLSTGKQVGSISIKSVTLIDPEDIDIDVDSLLWWADIGNNDPSDPGRKIAVYTHREPGPGFHGAVGWIKYPLAYPGGIVMNAETFINWPNRKRQIISKENEGRVYQLPSDDKLVRGKTNTLKLVHGPDPDLSFVSGAVVSKDGKWAFVICKDVNTKILVFDSSWNKVAEITMPSMSKPEGIGIQQDGKTLWVCTDAGAANGEYQSVKVDDDHRPVTKPTTPTPPPPPIEPCGA